MESEQNDDRAFKGEATPKEMIKYMQAVPPESIADITGKVAKPKKAMESCSQQLEL